MYIHYIKLERSNFKAGERILVFLKSDNPKSHTLLLIIMGVVY